MTIETRTPTAPETKEQAIALFEKFIKSRPGFEYGNYASGWQDTAGRAAYFSDVRLATKQRHRALEALKAFSYQWTPYNTELLVKVMRQAYSGRLSFNHNGTGLDYVAGQYSCTEYREAAASCLEAYLREL